MEMRRRKHANDLIHSIVYDNPFEFLSKSAHFRLQRQTQALSAQITGR